MQESLEVVGSRFIVVGGLLSSHVQKKERRGKKEKKKEKKQEEEEEKKKKSNILTVRSNVPPRNSRPLISKKHSNDNNSPFPTPDFIQGSFSFPL